MNELEEEREPGQERVALGGWVRLGAGVGVFAVFLAVGYATLPALVSVLLVLLAAVIAWGVLRALR